MRHALITFSSCLTAVLVALFAFDAWQRWRGQAEVDRTATVVAEVDARGRLLDQSQLAEQRAIELLRNDLVAIASAKTAVVESWLTHGRMPADNAAAGLRPSDAYRGRTLLSLSIVDGGRIRLRFDAESGVDGGIVELVPELGHVDAMGVQWRCETSDYLQIAQAMPGCDYVATQATTR